MHDLLRATRSMMLAVVLILAALTSTQAHQALNEPGPAGEPAGMQLLTAPLPDRLDAPRAVAASGDCASVSTTYVRQGAPTANYATEDTFYVGQDGGVMRGLLLFDLSALPPNVTINSATAQVYLVASYDYPGVSRTITAYRVASWWNEFLATWNGAPVLAEAYGSASVGHGAWGWYNMDVTSLVQAWHAGTLPNYGIMIRGSEDIAWREFASNGTIYAPRLAIDYSLPAQALQVDPVAANFVIGRTSGTTPTHTLRLDSRALTIDSTTVDVLGWSATKVGGATWLNLDQAGGFFSAAEPDVIALSVVTDTLTNGAIYTEQLQISTSPAVQGSPQTVDVTLWYTDGWRLNMLPIVAKNRSSSPHDYHTVALFIGIADYIYLAPAYLGVADLRQPPKGSDLGPGLANGDANNTRGMSIALGDECGCTGAALAADRGVAPAAACGGDFREDNTRVLTEWRATKTAIREAFRWLDQWENQDTLVLITFSGHGGYMADAPPYDEGDGYDEFIVAAESDGTSEMAGVISDDELAEWLDELESQNIVVILDSCFSGGMIGSPVSTSGGRVRTMMPDSGARLMAGDGLAQDINGAGRLIITASSATQESWEFGDLEGGALSYFLLRALLDPATDTDGDGWISFEEAFAYAAPQVDSYVSSHTGYHQNPQMSDGVDGEVKWVRP